MMKTVKDILLVVMKIWKQLLSYIPTYCNDRSAINIPIIKFLWPLRDKRRIGNSLTCFNQAAPTNKYFFS